MDKTKNRPPLTTAQVAAKFGVTNSDVLYAQRRGRLQGFKISGSWGWFFNEDELPTAFPVEKRKVKV